MGDEQHRHAHLALQLLQQFEDLRLNRDVERCGGLVCNQQVGLVGERHGDHHALALTSGQLMRVGVEALLGVADADLVQQLQHAGAHRLLVHVLVDAQHLADLPLNGVERIERSHRLLKDHRDAIAAHALQLLLGELEHVRGPRTRSRRRGARRTGRAGRRRIDRADTVLPDPDSPTRAYGLALANAERDIFGGDGGARARMRPTGRGTSSRGAMIIVCCHRRSPNGTSCAGRAHRARPRR